MKNKLKKGDILFKRSNGSFMHKLISLGQSAYGQDCSKIVHAAIYMGDNKICESSGEGIQINDFKSTTDTWIAFRHRDKTIREKAVEFAVSMAERKCARWRRKSVPVRFREKGHVALLVA